ncbi:MAG: GNAT family N-acetyltransferase [Thermoplasmata archaeon]|nr:GNAT family N-acetyltransferase [Thermoplasmata archaeon]
MRTNNRDVVIREIEQDDIDLLYAFFQEITDEDKHFFHPHPFDKKTVTKICNSKGDHYYIMLLDNKIIGYSMLRLFGYEIPSFGIYICKQFRNRGYGTILTKWTIGKAKRLGYKKVILKTYKENIAAQKVYKKVGFVIVGETPDGKQLNMELKL